MLILEDRSYYLRRLETEKYGNEVVCQWGMCVRKGGEDTWAKDW